MTRRRKFTDRRCAMDMDLLLDISCRLSQGQAVTLCNIPKTQAARLRGQFYWLRQFEQQTNPSYLASALTRTTPRPEDPTRVDLAFLPTPINQEIRAAYLKAVENLPPIPFSPLQESLGAKGEGSNAPVGAKEEGGNQSVES